jgi:hypothetical protein
MQNLIDKVKAANPVCRMLNEHKMICEETKQAVEKGQHVFRELKKETKPC